MNLLTLMNDVPGVNMHLDSWLFICV